MHPGRLFAAVQALSELFRIQAEFRRQRSQFGHRKALAAGFCTGVDRVGVLPKCVISPQLIGAFRGLGLLLCAGIVVSQGEVAIDPVDLALVRLDDLFRCRVKALAIGTFKIGVFNQGDGRVGIAIDVIPCARNAADVLGLLVCYARLFGARRDLSLFLFLDVILDALFDLLTEKLAFLRVPS